MNQLTQLGFDLTGKVALITGGSKGIGQAIARGLAVAGADVLISSRNSEELEQARLQILEGLEVRCACIVADLSKRSESARLGKEAISAFGRVDILINNAGSNIPEPVEGVQDSHWDNILELNLSSCMALTRELVPQMKSRNWGRIVHISSIFGLATVANRSVYAASKAGVIGLTRPQAIELGQYGITVNSIAPGPILTELPKTRFTEEQRREFGDSTVVGRWGETSELVGPVLLLASNAGSFVTGTTLVVDGGVLCRAF